jgi:hypothetical protein
VAGKQVEETKRMAKSQIEEFQSSKISEANEKEKQMKYNNKKEEYLKKNKEQEMKNE